MSSGDDRVLIRSANGTIANKMESDGSYIASFARSLWVTGVSVLLILVVFLEQLPKNSPHSRRRRRMGDRGRGEHSSDPESSVASNLSSTISSSTRGTASATSPSSDRSVHSDSFGSLSTNSPDFSTFSLTESPVSEPSNNLSVLQESANTTEIDPVRDRCPICLETLDATDSWRPFSCAHSGHIGCLATHLEISNRCPVCRAESEISPMHPVPASSPSLEEQPTPYLCTVCEEPCRLAGIWWPFQCEHPGHAECLEVYLLENRCCPICQAEQSSSQGVAATLLDVLVSALPEVCCVCSGLCDVGDLWVPFQCEHSGHIACMNACLETSGCCPVCSSSVRSVTDTSTTLRSTADTSSTLHRSRDQRDARICPICQDPCTPEDTVHPFPCAHPGHRACMENALRFSDKCPVCRVRAGTNAI